MKKLIFILLLLSCVGFAQRQFIRVNPFTSGSDTCANTTSQDTLDWQIGVNGVTPDTWNAVTNYITAAEKAAGTENQISLSDETGWKWAEYLWVRIRSEDDTITSNSVKIGHLYGSVTAFVQPDTSSGKSFYTVIIGGN